MKRRLAYAVAILLALPSVAYADVGTPLMWARHYHMFFGNVGLKDAEDLVDGVPSVVKENLPKAEAEALAKNLSGSGVPTEVRIHGAQSKRAD